MSFFIYFADYPRLSHHPIPRIIRNLLYMIHKLKFYICNLFLHPYNHKKNLLLVILFYNISLINWKCISHRSVGMDEILDHLGSGNPAIVLVNANLLFCDTCTCHAKKVRAVSLLKMSSVFITLTKKITCLKHCTKCDIYLRRKGTTKVINVRLLFIPTPK